jgi:hypothetical protein
MGSNLRVLAVILMLVVIPTSSSAFDKWTKTNTMLELSWLALDIVDWGQTLHIAKNPDEFHETNPLLGDHPSVSEVNRHFIIGAVIHAGFSYVLPRKYREVFQIFSIGWTGNTVKRNYNIGLRMNF